MPDRGYGRQVYQSEADTYLSSGRSGDDDGEKMKPKDFRVIVKLKNNRLIERRERHGLTQEVISKIIGISQAEYSAYECLSKKPWLRNRCGEIIGWTDGAKKIAAFYDCEPTELWPEVLDKIETSTILRKLDVSDIPALEASGIMKALAPGPHESMETKELVVAIEEALRKLTPREEFVIKRRFGLDGERAGSLVEIGKNIGKSAEYTRFIERRAMGKLRNGGARNVWGLVRDRMKSLKQT